MQRFTNSVTNRSGDSLRGGGCFDGVDHFLLAFRSSPSYFEAVYNPVSAAWSLRKGEGALSIVTLLELLVVVIIVIGGAMLAKTYFRTDNEQQELWKKSAESQNDLLNTALKKKEISAYRAMLDSEVTRFLPMLPYRADGTKLVGDLMEDQLGSADGAPGPMYSKKVQSFQNCILITYTFMMKGKQGDKPFDYTGKASRLWTRGKGGRWFLAHEHISFNG